MSIVLYDLVKRYGEQNVVDHMTLEVADGELFVLLGPSGSGKSTILRLIAGLTPVTAGRIALHGRDVTDLPPQQRGCGFVFQNYALFRHMTVAENIEFGLAVRKVPRQERARRRDELLDLVGLAGLGQRYPSQLSGGQQQRVAVARALAFAPSVLLLDEPFGALDVKIRSQLRQSLKEIQRRLGVTTILVTHDQEEAFELADRIGIIDRGRLLEVGTPTQLYHQPQHEFVATFLGSANLLAGTCEPDRVRLGALSLPYLAAMAQLDAEGRAEVLFRPEDLALARERSGLDGPVLGAGVVEQVTFLGALRHVRVRLDPLPGTWPLPLRYGEEGVALTVALLSGMNGTEELQVGQTVWVGIKRFHVLPRIALRLLICSDGLAEAEHVLHLGARLSKDTGGSATVLTVGEGRAEDALLTRAGEILKAAVPNLYLKARRGEAVPEILREIAEVGYDLVILGGQPDPRRSWAGGAIAERLVRESPIPVLVAKAPRPAIRRVLLCLAGGEPSKLDVMFTARLARRTSATVTLLHVHQAREPALSTARGPLSADRPPDPWLSRHLGQGRLTLLGQGVRVEAKIRLGEVVDEILAEAAEGDYDLIVVGGHLPSHLPSVLERDVAAEVVAQADRPVLVVRGKLQ